MSWIVTVLVYCNSVRNLKALSSKSTISKWICGLAIIYTSNPGSLSHSL